MNCRLRRPFSFSQTFRTFSIKNSKNDDASEKKRILVVGGGFGGLYTALQLSKLLRNENAEVLLLDPKDRFVFLPLLYELAVGSASAVEVAPTYDSLLYNSKVVLFVLLSHQYNMHSIFFQYLRLNTSKDLLKISI